MDQADVSVAGWAGIVTGASRGIGRATALELAKLGSSVLACARRAGEAGASGLPGTIVDVEVDVRDSTAMMGAADSCLSRFGRLDFLVANAGMVLEGELADADPADCRAVIETNLIGVLNAARAVLPTFRAQRRGHIVIVSSVSGRESYAGQTAYIASKWGQVGFGKALRKEAMAYDVRVSLVEPGIVDTAMARSSPLGVKYLESTRSLQPIDVAREIVHLLSRPTHIAINEVVIQPIDQSI